MVIQDVVAFQCRNPVHRAHYELFTRALDAENVKPGSVVLVHPTCGPTQVSASGDLRPYDDSHLRCSSNHGTPYVPCYE